MKLLLLMTAVIATNTLPIPQKYQKNGSVWMQTMTQAEIDQKCGKAPKGYITRACGEIGRPYIYMPNPCLYKEVSDQKSYAHLLCHELAHTQGWTHDKA